MQVNFKSIFRPIHTENIWIQLLIIITSDETFTQYSPTTYNTYISYYSYEAPIKSINKSYKSFHSIR